MSNDAITAVMGLQGLRSSGHKLVLLVLANRINSDGVCWPGIARIAENADMNPRNAQRILRELEMDGLITAVRRAGMSSIYSINTEWEKAINPVPTTPTSGVPTTPTSGVPEPDPRRPRHPTHDVDVTPPTKPTSPEPKENPKPTTQNTLAVPASERDKTEESGFEEFWNLYPRKEGKAAARKSWEKAAARAAPETILQGLAANLHQLRITEPRFRPAPARWLTEDRWHDQPPQPGRWAGLDNLEGALRIIHGATA